MWFWKYESTHFSPDYFLIILMPKVVTSMIILFYVIPFMCLQTQILACMFNLINSQMDTYAAMSLCLNFEKLLNLTPSFILEYNTQMSMYCHIKFHVIVQI